MGHSNAAGKTPCPMEEFPTEGLDPMQALVVKEGLAEPAERYLAGRSRVGAG